MAEFDYRPVACKRRAIASSWCASGWRLRRDSWCCWNGIGISFTSPTTAKPLADEIVFLANGRCNRENLIAQLKGGVKALTTPVNDLVSNWAYMVMASRWPGA